MTNSTEAITNECERLENQFESPVIARLMNTVQAVCGGMNYLYTIITFWKSWSAPSLSSS